MRALALASESGVAQGAHATLAPGSHPWPSPSRAAGAALRAVVAPLLL